MCFGLFDAFFESLGWTSPPYKVGQEMAGEHERPESWGPAVYSPASGNRERRVKKLFTGTVAARAGAWTPCRRERRCSEDNWTPAKDSPEHVDSWDLLALASQSHTFGLLNAHVGDRCHHSMKEVLDEGRRSSLAQAGRRRKEA